MKIYLTFYISLLKQVLKNAKLVILILLVAPLASSTCSISNTRPRLYTTYIAPKASAINKYRKPSAPP